MNPMMLRLALKGAESAFNYYRNTDSKKQREIYDALLDAVKKGKIGDVADNASMDTAEDLFSAARLEAGDVTRDIHDRLDRRRAAFAAAAFVAAAPDRKARREALKHEARAAITDDKKSGKKSGGAATAGKVVGGVLATAGLAFAAWKVWEYWLADKFTEQEEPKVYRPAPTRTETDAAGKSTLVYSTKTAGTGSAGAATRKDATVTNDPNNENRPVADMRGAEAAGTAGSASVGSAGPLGEAPAERDEALLASIDEQLTTMDTLEDSQREATAPRHGTDTRPAADVRPAADTSSDVLKDTGSGKRSDKVSDADTTIGASGAHELRKDAEDKK